MPVAAPVNGVMHDVWGYKFRWTDLHQTEEQLKPLLFTYDTAAAEVLDRVHEYKIANGLPVTGPAVRVDVYDTVKELAMKGKDEIINKFWHDANTVPDWVDWDQIERAQDVTGILSTCRRTSR